MTAIAIHEAAAERLAKRPEPPTGKHAGVLSLIGRTPSGYRAPNSGALTQHRWKLRSAPRQNLRVVDHKPSRSILRIMSATETDFSFRPALDRCIFTVISVMPSS